MRNYIIPETLSITAKAILYCLLLTATTAVGLAQANDPKSEKVAQKPSGFEKSQFTGEILPVFYVRDVLASVEFYVDKLGFTCHHYYDHVTGESVFEWTRTEPLIYAEMRAGDQKFALHRASQPESLMVGGMRHYFGVTDVQKHHRVALQRGLEAGDIIERPWMHMYRVEDPDGHELFIFTRPPEAEE
jgi:catechol 2,3-dioxygenase-like lactoylglutathione lyase family enzyme